MVARWLQSWFRIVSMPWILGSTQEFMAAVVVQFISAGTIIIRKA